MHADEQSSVEKERIVSLENKKECRVLLHPPSFKINSCLLGLTQMNMAESVISSFVLFFHSSKLEWNS